MKIIEKVASCDLCMAISDRKVPAAYDCPIIVPRMDDRHSGRVTWADVCVRHFDECKGPGFRNGYVLMDGEAITEEQAILNQAIAMGTATRA